MITHESATGATRTRALKLERWRVCAGPREWMKADKRPNNRVILFSRTINNSRGSAASESRRESPVSSRFAVLRSIYYKQLLQFLKYIGTAWHSNTRRRSALWRNARVCFPPHAIYHADGAEVEGAACRSILAKSEGHCHSLMYRKFLSIT